MLNWINELEEDDIQQHLEKDVQLIFQECGLETLCLLWEKLSGINLYISEKSLFAVKRVYIRRYHNPADPQFNNKALAVKLNVSEEFVKKTLVTTDETDDRQGKLY